MAFGAHLDVPAEALHPAGAAVKTRTWSSSGRKSPRGDQVASFLLDSLGSPPGIGALFGVAVKPGQDAVYFVDDNTNTLNLFH